MGLGWLRAGQLQSLRGWWKAKAPPFIEMERITAFQIDSNDFWCAAAAVRLANTMPEDDLFKTQERLDAGAKNMSDELDVICAVVLDGREIQWVLFGSECELHATVSIAHSFAVHSSPSLFLSAKCINCNVLGGVGNNDVCFNLLLCDVSCSVLDNQKQRKRNERERDGKPLAIVRLCCFVIHTRSSFQDAHTRVPSRWVLYESHIAQDGDQHEFHDSQWLMWYADRHTTDALLS